MQTTIQDPRIVGIDDMLTLQLSVAAIEGVDVERWENLETILGTSWEAAMIEGPKAVNGEATTKAVGTTGRVRMPLTMVIKPELLKTLQDHFKGVTGGGGTLGDGSSIGKEAKSMFDMSKEDFLAMMGNVGSLGKVSKGRVKPGSGSSGGGGGFAPPTATKDGK